MQKEKNRVLTILYLLIALLCVVLLGVVFTWMVKQKEKPIINYNSISSFEEEFEMTHQVIEQRMLIHNIPVIVYFMDDGTKKPLILLQHGLTSKKEDLRDLALTFAKNGYYIVTPDAYGHGELRNREQITVLESVAKISENFDVIFNFFEESVYVEQNRLCIMGISLGGMSALEYAATGSKEVKVVVSLCGTPDFETMIDQSISYDIFDKGQYIKTSSDTEAVKLKIKRMNPYKNLLQKEQLKLYLLCKEQDEVVPYEGNLKFKNEFSFQENLEFQQKANQGHIVEEEDLWEVLEYLKEHL